MSLTAADLEVIEFARASWGSAGRRDTAILERFNHDTVRFFQRLNHLISQPEADAYDPQLVRLLRARRARRRRTRTGFGRQL